MTSDELIEYYIGRLRTAGARNVGEYEERLRQNAPSVPTQPNRSTPASTTSSNPPPSVRSPPSAPTPISSAASISTSPASSPPPDKPAISSPTPPTSGSD